MAVFVNLDQFNAEIASWAVDEVPSRVNKLQRSIAMRLLTGVVKKTPVDTGRARGGWQISITTPIQTAISRVDKEGVGVAGTELAKLAELGAYDVIWITNNVEYILVLEEGLFEPTDPGPSKDPRKERKGRVWVKGGYSVQAPQGMLKVTVAEVAAYYQGEFE